MKLRVHPSVLIISLVTAITLFGDSLLYSVLPLYAESLGIPLIAVGLILSANRWVRLLSNPLAPRSFRKYGSWWPLLGATLAAVIATLVYAFPLGLIPFLAARFLWGISWSHLRLGSFMIILNTSRQTLGLAMGSWHAVTRLGSAFTVIVGGALIDRLGYQLGMTIMAALTFLAVIVVVVFSKALRVGANLEKPEATEVIASPESEPGTFKTDEVSGRKAPELSPLFCNLSAFVTSFVGAGLLVSSLSLIVQERFTSDFSVFGWELGIATITGLLFAVRWTSNLVVSPIAGSLSDWLGRRKTYLLLSIAQILGMIAIALFPDPLFTVIFACLLFFSGNSLEVVLDAAIGDNTHGEDTAKKTSIYHTFYDFGAACGPVIGYLIGTQLDFSIAYLAGAAMILALVISYLLGMFPQPTNLVGTDSSSQRRH